MRREGNSGQEQEGGWELPSIKELYFNLKGKEFLAQSGYTEFYEQTEKLPCFGEIVRSRQTAIRQLNLGTPKGLKTDTITEQQQLELFFMELRHGHLGLVLEKYFPLIKKYSGDPVFDTAMGQTLELRSTPNDAGRSLSFYVLVAWIHGFLWGLKHEDRADALARVYGVKFRSKVGNKSEVVRKTIAGLKLSGWSDYRHFYPKAPLSLVLFKQEECQFVFS